jgi:NTE family protein
MKRLPLGRRAAAIGALAALTVLVAGCAAPPAAPPGLDRVNPLQGYRFTTRPMAADNSTGLFVVLTFSGGGTRAAALAYGVLEALAGVAIEWEGRQRRLLDEVDTISAVSGGSVTAAYYALHGDRVFQEFVPRFLHQDVQGLFVRRLLNPGNWATLWSDQTGRSDLLAQVFDDLLFDGATYGDLLRGPARPFVTLSATDMVAGIRFEFVQEQFDLLCADLSGFPLARAVAASAAVPVLMSPILLPNRAGGCGFPAEGWAEAALRQRQLSSRRFHLANQQRSYLDAQARPYIHLLDGGLTDNLGLRSPMDAVFMREDAWTLVQALGIADVRKVVFIAVNASTAPDPRWSRASRLPGIGQVLRAFKDIPIDRYSFETKELLAASFERWAADIRRQRVALGDSAGDDLEFVLVDVDFEALHDAAEREALMQIPTRWTLDEPTVARIRRAARQLLAESPTYQQLLRDLRARPLPAGPALPP